MEDSKYNVHQGVTAAEKSILLQRSQSRVKQVEFELAVSNEVSTSLTTQLQEANDKVKKLQGQLDGSGKLQLGEAGLNQLLTISQAKLKKQQADGNLHGEQVHALRSDLQKSRKRLRELELERSIHLSKIDECLNMLEAQSSPEEHNLQNKVLKMTGLSHRVEYLQDQLDEKNKEIKELKEEGKINVAMVKELTKLLKPELDARQIKDTIDSLQKGRELSPEQAQLLTTQHLKSRVESLEEEKSTLFDKITDLTKQVEEASLVKNTTNNNGMSALKGKVDLSAWKSMVNSSFRKK
mmetsp:Transcript_8442/g.13968  ORF Transcript_8442/g.13968 Transcript_8442/m.13968 type:complete len:295 (+) Transcript_8442:68-952(+)|eukprot:CAMPEP_0119008226 /NCGR_PEP_ID=MMETSP1176-20130426/3547_1 /TAXON_ID=265551 /ORGANISM="Synedropsis recta cf, Strain CCMP1620" /LENGTH=294 /DNA_ID=CAMNT_0006960517 /DNA_START=64 /DNA_END=948 /DNA_ORIENTATION=-